MSMDFREFNRLNKFRQLVIQSGVKIDEAILTAAWKSEGVDLRGHLFLKGQPTPPSFHGVHAATAYELVCFSRHPQSGSRARAFVDWKKYDLVVAAGSTYKLNGNTLFLCLKKDGTFVGKQRNIVDRPKAVELLVAP